MIPKSDSQAPLKGAPSDRRTAEPAAAPSPAPEPPTALHLRHLLAGSGSPIAGGSDVEGAREAPGGSSSPAGGNTPPSGPPDPRGRTVNGRSGPGGGATSSRELMDHALEAAIGETLHAVEELERALRSRDEDIDRLEARCLDAERRLREIQEAASAASAPATASAEPGGSASHDARAVLSDGGTDPGDERPKAAGGVLAAIVSGRTLPGKARAPGGGNGGGPNGRPTGAEHGGTSEGVFDAVAAHRDALLEEARERGEGRHELEEALDHQAREVARIREELNRISDRIWAARQGALTLPHHEVEALVRRESLLIGKLKDARRLAGILQMRLAKTAAADREAEA